MKSIGVIGDIHSNVYALNAVFDEFAKRGIGDIVCLGDIIGIGIQTEEAVRFVSQRSDIIASLRGNHEGYLLCGLETRMNEEEKAFHRWEYNNLSETSKSYIRSLPLEMDIVIEDTFIYAVHYPFDEHGKVLSHEKARRSCKTADVCLYAHDHTRCIVRENGVLYCDFGSLGCPQSEKDIARAGILHIDGKTVEAEPVDVRYDVSPLIETWNRIDPPARAFVQKAFYGIE